MSCYLKKKPNPTGKLQVLQIKSAIMFFMGAVVSEFGITDLFMKQPIIYKHSMTVQQMEQF